MPSSFSTSPCRSVTVRPASPDTRSRTVPTMFWPRSKMCTPGSGLVTFTGSISCSTRVGAADCATGRGAASALRSTGVQDAASKPGRLQPGVSFRASYASPISRSEVSTGPTALRQLGSVTICCDVPSV
ncbi:hypothetical protein BJF79_45895 [Actinomadura sp. CNU-125]|nr:hypothetical protein [Actinomadura sp. CNU-125]OLT23625.1 hypothetical protein BJF79_45895 [Actinomadura sp. CNU-125]